MQSALTALKAGLIHNNWVGALYILGHFSKREPTDSLHKLLTAQGPWDPAWASLKALLGPITLEDPQLVFSPDNIVNAN